MLNGLTDSHGYAPYSNGVGTLGYIVCMQYFDNLVISVAVLMQPVAAEFMAYALGVSSLPGWLGWLGNFLVAGGTFAVVCSPKTDKEPAELTDNEPVELARENPDGMLV